MSHRLMRESGMAQDQKLLTDNSTSTAYYTQASSRAYDPSEKGRSAGREAQPLFLFFQSPLSRLESPVSQQSPCTSHPKRASRQGRVCLPSSYQWYDSAPIAGSLCHLANSQAKLGQFTGPESKDPI